MTARSISVRRTVHLSTAVVLVLIVGSPARAADSGVRFVASTSGPRGSVQGTRFVVEDPRTVFHLPEDQQVVVSFEWEGPPGDHDCEGLWKDPSGRVVLRSPARISAKGPRFSVYWTIALADNVTTGLWALEALVDGRPAGTHTFRIEGREPAARLPLAQLHAIATNALATVQAIGPNAERLANGAAFLLDNSHLLTAFAVVEGATTLRVSRPGGTNQEVGALASWNRRQGWAILRVSATGASVLPLAAKPLGIGDSAFFLDRGTDGGLVIVESRVVGASDAAEGPPRLNLSTAIGDAAIGGPLLDSSGQVAALLAGLPDARQFRSLALGLHGVAVVATPLAAIPVPSAGTQPTSLAEMARLGQFMMPLGTPRHIVSLTVAARVERRGALPMPIDQRDEFSRREGQAILFITWDPPEKRDAEVSIRVYDLDNRLISTSKPLKMRLRRGDYTITQWPLQIGVLPAGVYRIDVAIGDTPNGRTFLRITD